MVNNEKIGISLPKDIIRKVARAMEILHLRNRSAFFLLALKKLLAELPGEEDKKLERIYTEIEQTDKELLAHFSKHSYKNLPIYESK